VHTIGVGFSPQPKHITTALSASHLFEIFICPRVSFSLG
jgi:hypothetical protein